MPRIKLPDGSVREYDGPVSAAQVAADIGPRLARDALGARIDGELSDLGTPIERDAEVAIVTPKRRDGEPDDDARFLIRHSAAHVMAEAIQRIVPGVELVFGPPLASGTYGFFYDMAVPDGRPLSAEDFAAIEKEMASIIAENRPFTRYELSRDEGLAKLEAEGSKYKLDNAQQAIRQGSERLSWYVTGTPGQDWEDLCRGPHVPATGRIIAFKVMTLASSYWHGDASSDRLTRVYGTAFATAQELETHLAMLEEARKRDHRRLGKQLELFHFDEMVGPGLVLWTPNGAIIRRELEEFIRGELLKHGYQMVYTPHIGKLDLFRASGHFPYYRESQYPPLVEFGEIQKLAGEGATCADLANRLVTGDVEGYLLKPMNCPLHVKIYASQPRSYRDLPVRLAEFGTVYRYEQSGEIGGLTRVRGLTIDDAHLFCTEDQVADEIQGCLDLVKIVFGALGMSNYRVRVGLRDPASDKYTGSDEAWEKAEAVCRKAARSLGVPFEEETGEAAFYGPKIDFLVQDVLGREWQLGTIQVDYNLPERFDLSYTGSDNEAHRPVMIHRAPFGSFERFVGVLIEHYAGAFPTWLAPEQVRVLPISEKTAPYSAQVLACLRDAGVRASVDDSQGRIQARIKVATDARIPYLLVVGPRDEAAGEVSVRARGFRQDLGAIPLEAFAETLAREIASRGQTTVVDEHFQVAAV
jgi:threonyl-tRNA synthetase